MDKLAKRVSAISAILAVPIALFMGGVLFLALATEHYGITSRWKFSELLWLLSGVIYPVVAAISWKMVRDQSSQKVALAWSLAPVPVLLLFAFAVLAISQ